MKYHIEWWEERIYRCQIDIDADSKEEAVAIASGYATDEVEYPRDWTDDERETYYEYLNDTPESEILSVELK